MKAGPPEDMTVVILRELLTELKVPFKTSDKKQVLINKVREKQQNLNETGICSHATI